MVVARSVACEAIGSKQSCCLGAVDLRGSAGTGETSKPMQALVLFTKTTILLLLCTPSMPSKNLLPRNSEPALSQPFKLTMSNRPTVVGRGLTLT